MFDDGADFWSSQRHPAYRLTLASFSGVCRTALVFVSPIITKTIGIRNNLLFMSKRRTALEQLFDQLNAELFGGRLPSYRVRQRARFAGELNGQLGRCDEDVRTIWLKTELPADRVRPLLLHEMCHHGSPGHGRAFQAKLLRLAEHGEDWAREEAAQYQEAIEQATRHPLTKQIRDEIGRASCRERV